MRNPLIKTFQTYALSGAIGKMNKFKHIPGDRLIGPIFFGPLFQATSALESDGFLGRKNGWK